MPKNDHRLLVMPNSPQLEVSGHCMHSRENRGIEISIQSRLAGTDRSAESLFGILFVRARIGPSLERNARCPGGRVTERHRYFAAEERFASDTTSFFREGGRES